MGGPRLWSNGYDRLRRPPMEGFILSGEQKGDGMGLEGAGQDGEWGNWDRHEKQSCFKFKLNNFTKIQNTILLCDPYIHSPFHPFILPSNHLHMCPSTNPFIYSFMHTAILPFIHPPILCNIHTYPLDKVLWLYSSFRNIMYNLLQIIL